MLLSLQTDYPKGANVSVEELKKKMFQKHSNVSRLVEKLLIKGYITKRLSTTDKRSVCITLTGKGSSVTEEIVRERETILKPLFQQFDNSIAHTDSIMQSMAIFLKANYDI